jgi:hypothetical protein
VTTTQQPGELEEKEEGAEEHCRVAADGSQLPAGWASAQSTSTDETYYYNDATSESTYDVPTQPTAEAQRQEIVTLYSVHNPAKVDEVGALIDKYGETKLLAMVRKKYVGQQQQQQQLESLTGAAAARALQQHIAQKVQRPRRDAASAAVPDVYYSMRILWCVFTQGTSDIQTVERLRRASLQPDGGLTNDGQVSQMHYGGGAAEEMAAAAAAIAEEEEEEEEQDPEGDEGGAGIEVTFSETRPLGITWVKWIHAASGDETAAIKTIKPAGQGAACGKLKPGLLLATVGGQEGLNYTEQIAAIQVLVCVKDGV